MRASWIRVVMGVASLAASAAALAQEPLWATRDRWLDAYAKERGLADRCAAWAFVTHPANNKGGAETRKYVFLTISHNLSLPYVLDVDKTYKTNARNKCEPLGTSCNGSGCRAPATTSSSSSCLMQLGTTCAANGWCDVTAGGRSSAAQQERISDHVESVYGIMDDASGSCSSLGNNRLYGRLTARGIEAFRDLGSRGVGMYGPMNWRSSQDWGGPHAPFTGSRESDRSGPRAQVHYFLFDGDARPIARREVETVNHPRAFEMDLDYNWLHDSNPVCTYSGKKGYDRYKATWGEGAGWTPVEYEYTPGGCAGARIGAGGVVDAWTWTPITGADRYVAIFGTGFATASGGNRVYFVQANPGSMTPTTIAAEVVYDSAGQLNVKVPAGLRASTAVGPAYVYVLSSGRRTNTERIAIQ